jgi:hypothetical protein
VPDSREGTVEYLASKAKRAADINGKLLTDGFSVNPEDEMDEMVETVEDCETPPPMVDLAEMMIEAEEKKERRELREKKRKEEKEIDLAARRLEQEELEILNVPPRVKKFVYYDDDSEQEFLREIEQKRSRRRIFH